jgi:NAD(P)-dependent dehydrogenase (short-subunit alcohol dehydrogenase family)
VLVVGGSGGIGQSFCREFARAGTDVAIVDEVAKLTAVSTRSSMPSAASPSR